MKAWKTHPVSLLSVDSMCEFRFGFVPPIFFLWNESATDETYKRIKDQILLSFQGLGLIQGQIYKDPDFFVDRGQSFSTGGWSLSASATRWFEIRNLEGSTSKIERWVKLLKIYWN